MMWKRGQRIRSLLALGLVMVLVLPVGLQARDNSGELSKKQVSSRLETLRDTVRTVQTDYTRAVGEDGARIVDQSSYDRALQGAEEVRAAFGQKTNTALFEAIQQHSPYLADVLKARSSRLVGLIVDRAPPKRVQELVSELDPGLNRSVILVKGRVYPRGERTLKNELSIRQATKNVMERVNRSIRTYEKGQHEKAARLANDAFFEFESNGMGPDSVLVDEGLENQVESDIASFGPGAREDPGLEQLMRAGAGLDRVRTQRDRIFEGLEQIRDLLISTLPKSIRGDTNGDEQLTITDSLLIAQASLGLRSLDVGVADVNCDGRVSIADALLVAQASLDMRKLSNACSG